MNRFLLGATLLILAGCGSWPSLWRPSPPPLLDRADGLALEGEYAGALSAYDEVLRAQPEGPAALRARAGRQTVAALVAAQEEVARLRGALAELARLRDELAAREAELMRLRQDLAARQADLQRLTAEADRLRADIENLKRIDLRLERQRR